MSDVLGAVFLLAGTALFVVATVGSLRMPDILMRLHAITKAGTLGVGLVVASVICVFSDLEVVTRALAIIGFVVLTAPVAAHRISRAAYYFADFEPWEGTFVDELRRRSEPAGVEPSAGERPP